ncbi:MAG TPA: hypothetical protein P5227_03435, partial [Emcibacteraceae bacterium]|nr:hypothetical protein [Emcibacteraceae bacterium]
MSDDKNKKTPLSTSGRKTLQMKPAGTVGSGSGSNGVVVQRKKKLIMPGQKPVAEKQTLKPKSIISTPFDAAKKADKQPTLADDKSAGGLSESEREMRAKVLEKAQKDSEERAKRAAEEAKRKAVEEAAKAERLAKEAEENKSKPKKEAPPKKDVDEEKRQADLEIKRKREEEAARIAEAEAAAARVETGHSSKTKEINKAEKESLPKNMEVKKSRLDESRRRSGRLTVTQALSGNMERQRSLASLKRKRAKEKRQSGLVEP